MPLISIKKNGVESCSKRKISRGKEFEKKGEGLEQFL